MNEPSQRAGRRRWRGAAWLSLLLILLALVIKFLGPRAVVSYQLLQARRALAKLEVRDAVGCLQAAQLWQPERADVQFMLGTVFRRIGLFLRAREHLERARTLGYFRREIERQELMLTFQMGHITEAEPALTKLLQQGDDDEMAEEIYEAMVLGYMWDFRVQDASLCLSYWIDWRPESIRARLLRVHLYGAMEATEQMELELREVLRLEPERVDERLTLADSLLRKKQVEGALAECEICRKHQPRNPRVSLQLGLCHYELGRLDEARRELDSAVGEAGGQVEPLKRARGLIALGQIALDAQEFERAADHFQRAVDLVSYDTAAVYGLGTALSRLGKRESAERYLQRSAVLAEQDTRLADINRQLPKESGNVELRVEAAMIMVEQGRKSDAAAWMQSVLRHDPQRREAHELLADFYEALGRAELAEQHRGALRTGVKIDVPSSR